MVGCLRLLWYLVKISLTMGDISRYSGMPSAFLIFLNGREEGLCVKKFLHW